VGVLLKMEMERADQARTDRIFTSPNKSTVAYSWSIAFTFMGYSLSWLAIKGKTPQVLLEELGFRATGKHEEVPEADHSAVELPNGRYLIVSNRTEQVAPDSTMRRLSSSGCELVTCFVEEHVMCSHATGWKNGCKCWSVIHDAQRGIEHLDTEGDLPLIFGSIRDRLLLEQQDGSADYIFDIPVEVAKSLTGYRHNLDIPGASKEPFEVLICAVAERGARPQGLSFWKRFFRA